MGCKRKALWLTCYKCFARKYSHPNCPCLASSHVAFRERWTRGSGIDYFWWTAKKQQFFFINNYVIYLITTLGSTRLSTFWFKRKLNCLKNKTGLDLLTMLWTTEVLINKIINEEHPKGVYFAPYWGKWLLMITTGFCSMSPLIGWVT